MERLISSTVAIRIEIPAPLPRHRQLPLLLPRSSALSPVTSLPRHGYTTVAASLFSKQEGPPPPSLQQPAVFLSPNSSSLASVSSCFVKEDARGARACDKVGGGGELVGSVLRKVVRSVVVILLSAIVLTTIQPILAPPSYATLQSAAKSGRRLIRAELLSSAWTGFFTGCLHTLSGPDHLAALAPLSIGRTRIQSALVGALWGCGHDAGQMIFGLLFLLLKDRLHIEVLRTWGTRVVGLTLLVIGAMGIREASEVPTPCVALENGECNVSFTEQFDAVPTGKQKVGFATFATGIVHGLQPDALMMVLPALALPSRLAGAAFLCMFLVGTVFAMGSYTVFIGSCTQALKDRVPRITEKLTWAASLVAISMGLAILISQFFGFNLY